MYAQERQQRIVNLAQRFDRVSVQELAERFEVTTETIRRDLDSLAGRGLLRRVHGGAVPAEQLRLLETALSTRQTRFSIEKGRIARAALEYVPQGQGGSLLLDGGTTTAAFASLLPGTGAGLVVTNSAQAAAQLAVSYPGEVELLGGRVRGVTGATVGGQAIDRLVHLRVDVAFLGANGISVNHGCSTPDNEEAAVKRAMRAAARRVIVLADSSKVGAELVVSFASLAEIDVLITDSGIARADHDQLVGAGLEVVVA